jgi:hypothetical protein
LLQSSPRSGFQFISEYDCAVKAIPRHLMLRLLVQRLQGNAFRSGDADVIKRGIARLESEMWNTRIWGFLDGR